MTQRIIVERRGCGSGCGTFLAVVLVLGLAIQYWYAAIPVAIALAAGAWWWNTRSVAGGTYECPRCHGRIANGQVTCGSCGFDVRTPTGWS